MAGESPDKTEQRKSSGTAAEEHDPRFAVFREPGAGADVDGAASDTATAVFRPRLPEGESSAPASASAPASSTAASSSTSSSASTDSAAEGPSSGAGKPASGEEEPAKASGGAVTPQKLAGDSVGEPSDSEGSEGSEALGVAAEAPEGDGEDRAGERVGAEPEPGDVRLRAAVAAWVDAAAEDTTAEDVAAEGDEAEGGAESGPKADAESKPESKPEAERVEESAGKPAGVEEPEPEAEAKAKADQPETGADSSSEAGTASDTGSDTPSGTGSDLRGIDQPTAVFKAVAPPKKVDQPTTALKLSPQELQDLKAAGDKAGDQAGDQARDKAGDQARDKPESTVERTSTFVPLRSDDVRERPAPASASASASAPAPRKPEPGSPETKAPAGAPEATPAPAPAAPSWAAAERTRQQPLPPKPPLDLLAELTNTPPPAETPVRTVVRRIKIWTPLVLLLLIIFAIAQMMRPLPEPVLELTAKPTYAFEGGETELSWPGQGQSAVMVDGVGSLGSEGAQKPAPIASVAKVMTAYVILKDHPLKGDEEGETITVDQKAEDESQRPDESTAPLTKGQQLSQRQMLQLLMIPSGNNAARLLARWDAGSEDAFIDKMNDAAKDLGMTDSTYTDPSGLEKTTVSTATDQLKLAQAVMRNEVFREIVDMPEVEIKGIDGKIYNNNTLLLEPGVSGIKTGSSTPAGGNLLWSANTVVDGKRLWIYGAVMGQQAGTGRVYDSLTLSLTNSLKLIKDAQKAATSATVVKKGDVVGYVDNGFGARTPVIATKNLKAVGWPGLEVELKVTDSGKGIEHAAKSGSEVGMVTVGTGTGKVTAPVVLQDDLTEPAIGDKLTRIGIG
ncbi:serine hydrolase [Streptomyces sp. NPDC059452]|uniref:D-alanyl-D-alanine carboxypeptidase n=1 Tax=Streptomyces sp. NPDC059452 TaxID=3346835 RepID=UPI0036BB9F7A